MRLLCALAFVFCISSFGSNIVYFSDIKFPTPIKREVNIELVVDQIVEVALFNEARIDNPTFVFDYDFGYGLEVLPGLRVDNKKPSNYTYISEWICLKAGYAVPTRVSGSREVLGSHVMHHSGSPRDKSAKGPYLSQAENESYPSTLYCAMK